MAEIEVFVEDAGVVEGGGDSGQFGDQPPFEGGEGRAIELTSELGQRDVQLGEARQLGHHEVALQGRPGPDSLTGGDHIRNGYAQLPGPFDVRPLRGRGRMVSTGINEGRHAGRPGQPVVALQVDRQRCPGLRS